jgi:hypothetical protein
MDAATAATMNPIEAAQALPPTRYRVEALYLAARRGDGPLDEIDARWRDVLVRVAGPPAVALGHLLAFEEWITRITARLERERREAEASAAAAAAERHAHSQDAIVSGVYAAATGFVRMVDGVTLSFASGALLEDRTLVARLLAADAPVYPIDESEIATCTCGCRFRFKPFNEGARR